MFGHATATTNTTYMLHSVNSHSTDWNVMPNNDIANSGRERADILNDVIADYAREGWTISAVTSGQAIAQRKESLGGPLIALLYVVLTVITGGLFLILIAIMLIGRGIETVVIKVDEHGELHLS